MNTWFKQVDLWLLPRKLEQPYMPYVWLIYLPLFFGPVFYWSPEPLHWLYAVVASFVFIGLYFRSYWVTRKQLASYILAITVLATLCVMFTVSAQTFYIYAAAFCCRLPTQKQAFSALAGILILMGIVSVLLELPAFFYIPGIAFSLIVGVVNIYQFALHEKKKELILTQEEVQRLAKVAERERIARDLHDLIGHTFSVITLKADLAGRLLDKGLDINLQKARAEIKQLESISRDALSQVREVVSGYRSSDLLSELANAKHVLASLDIDFDYELKGLDKADLELDLHNNKELAIVLRELVTNVIKHANATRVKVLVERIDERLIINCEDNGIGIQSGKVHGFGLKGIEERIGKLSGTVSVQSGQNNQGTLAVIGVPFGVENDI